MSKDNANEQLRKMLYGSRDCGDCRACCVTHAVRELDKKEGARCQHLRDLPERGCARYTTRPLTCEQYACLWRSGSDVLRPHERPDMIGVVIDAKSSFILFAKETMPGGFQKAERVLTRLAGKRVVTLIEQDGSSGVAFGPAHRMMEYVGWMKAYNEGMRALKEAQKLKEAVP